MKTNRVNLLLVSKKNEHALKLREDLERNPGYTVHFEETAEAAMKQITSGKMHCVVFNFERFGQPQLGLIKDIKKLADVFQILIFADQADPEAVQAIKGAKSVILIEKPLLNLERDIAGLCERIIGGESVYQRESKRHPTTQKVKLELLRSGKVLQGFVTDISQNGACVEIEKTTLQFQDKVRLTINLDELGRQRTMYGEIRWSKTIPKGTVAGIQFLKSPEK